MRLGRVFVGATMIFYAIQHFLFPQFVPGVPLEKMIPAWVPAPTLLSYFIGITLLLAGIGLLVRRTIRIAAASSGMVLLLLTAFFYVPILVMEIHYPARGGRNQLRGRYDAIRSDCFAGGLRRGPADDLRTSEITSQIARVHAVTVAKERRSGKYFGSKN